MQQNLKENSFNHIPHSPTGIAFTFCFISCHRYTCKRDFYGFYVKVRKPYYPVNLNVFKVSYENKIIIVCMGTRRRSNRQRVPVLQLTHSSKKKEKRFYIRQKIYLSQLSLFWIYLSISGKHPVLFPHTFGERLIDKKIKFFFFQAGISKLSSSLYDKYLSNPKIHFINIENVSKGPRCLVVSIRC